MNQLNMLKILLLLNNIANRSSAKKWEALSFIQQEFKRIEESGSSTVEEEKQQLEEYLKFEGNALRAIATSPIYNGHPFADRIINLTENTANLHAHSSTNFKSYKVASESLLQLSPLAERAQTGEFRVSTDEKGKYLQKADSRLHDNKVRTILKDIINIAAVKKSFFNSDERCRTNEASLIHGLCAFVAIDVICNAQDQGDYTLEEALSDRLNSYTTLENKIKTVEYFVCQQVCEMIKKHKPDYTENVDRYIALSEERFFNNPGADIYWGDPRIQTMPWVTQAIHFGLSSPDKLEDMLENIGLSINNNFEFNALTCSSGINERLMGQVSGYLSSTNQLVSKPEKRLNGYIQTVSSILFDNTGALTEKTAQPALGDALAKYLTKDDITTSEDGEVILDPRQIDSLAKRIAQQLIDDFDPVSDSPYFTLRSKFNTEPNPLQKEVAEWLRRTPVLESYIEKTIAEDILLTARLSIQSAERRIAYELPTDFKTLRTIESSRVRLQDVFSHVNAIEAKPLYQIRAQFNTDEDALDIIERINKDAASKSLEDLENLVDSDGNIYDHIGLSYYEKNSIIHEEIIESKVYEKLLEYELKKKRCLKILGKLELYMINTRLRELNVTYHIKMRLEAKLERLNAYITCNSTECTQIDAAEIYKNALSQEEIPKDDFTKYLLESGIGNLVAEANQDNPPQLNKICKDTFQEILLESYEEVKRRTTIKPLSDILNSHDLSNYAIEQAESDLKYFSNDLPSPKPKADEECIKEARAVYTHLIKEAQKEGVLNEEEFIMTDFEGQLVSAEKQLWVHRKLPSVVGIDGFQTFAAPRSLHGLNETNSIIAIMKSLDINDQISTLAACDFEGLSQTTAVADYIAQEMYLSHHQFASYNENPEEDTTNDSLTYATEFFEALHSSSMTESQRLHVITGLMECSQCLKQEFTTAGWKDLYRDMLQKRAFKTAYMIRSMFPDSDSFKLSDEQLALITGTLSHFEPRYQKQLLIQECTPEQTIQLLNNRNAQELHLTDSGLFLEKLLANLESGRLDAPSLEATPIRSFNTKQSNCKASNLQARIVACLIEKYQHTQSDLFDIALNITNTANFNVHSDILEAWANKFQPNFFIDFRFNETLEVLDTIAKAAAENDQVKKCLLRILDNSLVSDDITAKYIDQACRANLESIAAFITRNYDNISTLNNIQQTLNNQPQKTDTTRSILDQIKRALPQKRKQKVKSRFSSIVKPILYSLIAIGVLIISYFLLSSLVLTSISGFKQAANLFKPAKIKATAPDIPTNIQHIGLRA